MDIHKTSAIGHEPLNLELFYALPNDMWQCIFDIFLKSKNGFTDLLALRLVDRRFNSLILYNVDFREVSYKLCVEKIKKNSFCLHNAPQFVVSDQVLAVLAINKCGLALQSVNPMYRNMKEIVLLAVTKWGQALAYASPNMRDDREVVLSAVMQEGTALQFASDELRTDEEIALAAIRQNPKAFKFILPPLCNSKTFAIKAMETNNKVFKLLNWKLKRSNRIRQLRAQAG